MSKDTKKAPEMSDADKQASIMSATLAKQWREPVFGMLDVAEKSDITVSSFIFGRIQEAPSVKAAEFAFQTLEENWRDAHQYTAIVTHGPKTGAEATMKPPIPATWRVQKSTLLKLCRTGPEQAALVTGDALFAAVKELHLSAEAIRKMYHLDGDKPLDCSNDIYRDNLKVYRDDVKAVQSFLTRFGKKETAPGTGDGAAGEQSKLPGPILTALSNYTRKVREALDNGATQEAVETGILAAITAMNVLSGKAADARRESLNAKQRKDANRAKLAGIVAERAEVEQVAAKAS